MELDENKRFLLALLYLFTHPANSDNDLERYIKDFALYCVIYDLIIKGILDYDYSPK